MIACDSAWSTVMFGSSRVCGAVSLLVVGSVMASPFWIGGLCNAAVTEGCGIDIPLSATRFGLGGRREPGLALTALWMAVRDGALHCKLVLTDASDGECAERQLAGPGQALNRGLGEDEACDDCPEAH